LDGAEEEVAQTMYIHVSKYKNDLKKEKNKMSNYGTCYMLREFQQRKNSGVSLGPKRRKRKKKAVTVRQLRPGVVIQQRMCPKTSMLPHQHLLGTLGCLPYYQQGIKSEAWWAQFYP
jgi:hypothetical protein